MHLFLFQHSVSEQVYKSCAFLFLPHFYRNLLQVKVLNPQCIICNSAFMLAGKCHRAQMYRLARQTQQNKSFYSNLDKSKD